MKNKALSASKLTIRSWRHKLLTTVIAHFRTADYVTLTYNNINY